MIAARDAEDDPDIGVVIPCRNEEANVAQIAAAVIAALEPTGASFEILFIDNDSSDRTVEILRALCAKDARIRVIVNARDFGQMRSPTHAVFTARGRAVIGMCADFQDPPELLPEFVTRWRRGAEIVLGVREKGRATWLFGSLRGLFYRIAAALGEYRIVPDATGFGLYDRKVLDELSRLHEPEPFFRGMLVETGRSIEIIRYPRPGRLRGLSNNNVLTLLDFALSAFASSSKKMIRLPFVASAVCGVLAFGLLLMIPVVAILGYSVLGWLAAAAVELQFSALFGFLGLIGDQVRLTSERTRGTPLVFERERINFVHDDG